MSGWKSILLNTIIVSIFGGCAEGTEALGGGSAWTQVQGNDDNLIRASTFGERIGYELDTLIQQIGPMAVLYVVLIFTIALVLSRLMELAMTTASRRGWNIPRRWGHWVLFGQFVCFAWAWIMVFRPLFLRVPMLGIVLFAALALFVAIVLQESLQSIAAGLFISLRGHLHIGDQIEVGTTKGAIVQFRLTHTRLRMPDRSTQWIPNRMLAQDAVKIGQVQNASPVQVLLTTGSDRADESDFHRQLKQIAWISPYRRAESSVSVASNFGLGQTSIEIQTWATRETDEVTRRLRGIVEQQLISEKRNVGA